VRSGPLRLVEIHELLVRSVELRGHLGERLLDPLQRVRDPFQEGEGGVLGGLGCPCGVARRMRGSSGRRPTGIDVFAAHSAQTRIGALISPDGTMPGSQPYSLAAKSSTIAVA
jgi:hypothetical protein